jgi:hypothetical protein
MKLGAQDIMILANKKTDNDVYCVVIETTVFVDTTYKNCKLLIGAYRSITDAALLVDVLGIRATIEIYPETSSLLNNFKITESIL